MPGPGTSRKREAANKLHTIRDHERSYSEGVSGTKSYFTPSLVEICAKVVAETFPDQPRIESALRQKRENDAANKKDGDPINTTGDQLLQLVTCQLSTDLPLDVCVGRVTAEDYWKARSEARWPRSQGQLPAFVKYQDQGGFPAVAGSGGAAGDTDLRKKLEPDWKRTYLERHLEEFMMCMDDEDETDGAYGVPAGVRLAELAELSKLTPEKASYMTAFEILENVCRLAPEKIVQLHLDRHRAHLDWVSLFSWLPNLKDFRVTFSVLDAGMHFRFNMFGIRKSDIVGRDHDKDTPPRGFVKVLRDPRCCITNLALPENQIGDEETKGLLLGLIMNQTVERLDLSHNTISCEGAKAIATLLMKVGNKIRDLNLADNAIGVGGGKALGKALQLNTTLETLSLRLNRLLDDGASPVVLGLKANTSLKTLNLSNNELGSNASEALAEALRVNTTLESLYVTGNMLAEEGGRTLLEAAKANASLTTIDARSSGVSAEDVNEINRILKQRVDMQKRAAEAEKEKLLREQIDSATNAWRSRFYVGE